MPDEEWLPDPSWPDPPEGWEFWVADRDLSYARVGYPTVLLDASSPEHRRSDLDLSADHGTWWRALPRNVRIGWGVVGVLALIGAADAGITGVLNSLLVIVGLVGLWAAVVGRARWAGLRNRWAGVVAFIVVLFLVGKLGPLPGDGVVTPAAKSPSVSGAPVPPSPVMTETRAEVEAALDDADPGTALRLLASLTVRDVAEAGEYQRSEFGRAWSDVDGNGCGTRNDVLRRDLVDVTVKRGTGGCVVMTGRRNDPYTGDWLDFSRPEHDTDDVSVDHVVALENAWVSGAADWSAGKRERFANDPLNLLVVSAAANRAKGSADAADWLPARVSYRCAYVGRQVAVKAKYDAGVTVEEQEAMVGVLLGCPDRKAPKARPIPLTGNPSYQAPARDDAETGGAEDPGVDAPEYEMGVSPGAFCEPRGALGLTKKGTPMKCSQKVGEKQPRWRSVA
jgi:hypothetical protein